MALGYPVAGFAAGAALGIVAAAMAFLVFRSARSDPFGADQVIARARETLLRAAALGAVGLAVGGGAALVSSPTVLADGSGWGLLVVALTSVAVIGGIVVVVSLTVLAVTPLLAAG